MSGTPELRVAYRMERRGVRRSRDRRRRAGAERPPFQNSSGCGYGVPSIQVAAASEGHTEWPNQWHAKPLTSGINR
jgi:hypothetical protein